MGNISDELKLPDLIGNLKKAREAIDKDKAIKSISDEKHHYMCPAHNQKTDDFCECKQSIENELRDEVEAMLEDLLVHKQVDSVVQNILNLINEARIYEVKGFRLNGNEEMVDERVAELEAQLKKGKE